MKPIRLALLVSLLGSNVLTAAIMWNITAVNNTGGDVFDIHVLISGTGGTIHDLVGISPAGQTIGSPNGNDIDASWDPALPAGGTWEADFKTLHEPLKIEVMYWTDKNGGKITDVPEGDRTITRTGGQGIPEPSTFQTMGVGALLLLSGFRGLRGNRHPGA